MAGGPLTNDQRSKEYYRLAYMCAERKAQGACQEQCAACTLNVHLYIDDPRDATLIKTSAAMDFMHAQQRSASLSAQHKVDNVVTALQFAFMIAIFVVPIFFVVRCAKKAVIDSPNQSTTYIQMTYDAANFAAANIEDVNEDGKVGCIDYALLFKAWFDGYNENGHECLLIWNVNHKKDMNHLFVKVWDGYQYVAIEPSTNRGSFDDRRMEKYWGSMYDPRFDRNVTDGAYKIWKNTFVWVW